MPETIPVPPSSFSVAAHGRGWYRWSEVADCFFPRYRGGTTSAAADEVLAPAKDEGGIYLIAQSASEPASPRPEDAAVVYVGETVWFKRRMDQFGDSAGLWGARANGHSAGWRYTGSGEDLWVAFFVVEWPLAQPHLAEGMRKWLESVALEEYRQVHSRLPPLNEGEVKEKAA